jgi:antitoxin PrlF
MQPTSKMTEKYQATIPLEVRKLLDLGKGDSICFDIRENEVLLRKVEKPLELAFAEALQASLSEWSGDADDEAYRDL